MDKDIANSLLLVEFAQRKEVVFAISSSQELNDLIPEAIAAADAEEKEQENEVVVIGTVPAKVQANPPPQVNNEDAEMDDVSADAVSTEEQAANAPEPIEVEVKDEEAEKAAREKWDNMFPGQRPVTLVKWYNVNNGRPIRRPDLIESPAKKPKLSGKKNIDSGR